MDPKNIKDFKNIGTGIPQESRGSRVPGMEQLNFVRT
jgi:hypothetical protein